LCGRKEVPACSQTAFLCITPSGCKLVLALWALSKEKKPPKWIGRVMGVLLKGVLS
jgi:hypothetical protein